MPLVFVFVVCGVTVVDAAAVVTHTRDGHAVGVAEHRCHGHPYTRLTWLPSVKCDGPKTLQTLKIPMARVATVH